MEILFVIFFSALVVAIGIALTPTGGEEATASSAAWQGQVAVGEFDVPHCHS